MKKLFLKFLKIPRKALSIIYDNAEFIYYRIFYKRPKVRIDFKQKRFLLVPSENIGELAAGYRRLFPDKVQNKILQADLICEHIFDLLGSGPKKLGPDGPGYQSIDWHSDFKSNYRWNPKTFYKNIPLGPEPGIDIKVPMELSRFQHLTLLGQAYILTNNKRYSQEFQNQINDWIKKNPVGFGVNWKSTMDVAIRAANWLVAMEYFFDNDLFSEDFLNEFYTSIYEHGKFIRSHLEYSPTLTANHYLADIVGLLFIAVYCPFFEETKSWLLFCKKEIEKEMLQQVYQDGCNFEASTSYHRLVLELLFYSQLLCKRSGINFSVEYKAKLTKMFQFSLYSLKPNGMAPQIGDNDNGRFIIFCNRPILEHKYLVNWAAIYYKNPEFKPQESNFDEESFWIFGLAGERRWNNLPYREKGLRSKAFPDAGWFIIRHDQDYCFISCGSNGQNGIGGHAHNDKLSFELMVKGREIIVDPGTYIYTPYPGARNKFRSTEYHNTIKFNNFEQNNIPKSLFSLPDRVQIIFRELKETQRYAKFHGHIQYSDITHKRSITLDKKTRAWQIIDQFSSKNSTTANLYFHLSPHISYDQKHFLLLEGERKIASLVVKDHKLIKNRYYYSPEYGLKTKSERLSTKIPLNNTDHIITTSITTKP